MFRSFNSRQQQGNILLLAIFVIFVMGMLAMSLLRVSWSNQDTLTREMLGNQANLLARSANQWGLTQLFPLNGSEDFEALSQRCNTLSSNAATAAAALVTNSNIPCLSPIIACESSSLNVPDELRYLRLTSVAKCNSGNIFEVQREQSVWVRGIKDE
ncbi:hypothetical protein [Vibrio gallicus]|uniref:hypothetical protein n=1 Tax=Vibrio gallicus TaxID=190897 RepID=UPI0021C2BC3D|nr:hypothetical protein [Vibrio gallicus]